MSPIFFVALTFQALGVKESTVRKHVRLRTIPRACRTTCPRPDEGYKRSNNEERLIIADAGESGPVLHKHMFSERPDGQVRVSWNQGFALGVVGGFLEQRLKDDS
jgi:hypothetical protein